MPAMRTSVTALLLCSLAAWASPADIPSLGFSVDVTGSGPAVVAVTPGSPADVAGVKPGLALVAVHRPRSRQLARATLEQVVAALTVGPQEQLIFAAMSDGRRKTFIVANPDLVPEDEFPTVPLPPEQVAKLSPGQQQRYLLKLARQMQPTGRPPPPPGVSARVERRVSVSFTAPPRPRFLSVSGGGTARGWITADVVFSYQCPSGEAVGLDVTGASPGLPLHLALVRGAGSGGSQTRQLSLWRQSDAAKSCDSGLVDAVALNVSVRCSGGGVQKGQLAPSALEVTCEGVGEKPDATLAHRKPTIREDDLVEGGDGTVQVWLTLSGVSPPPAQLTPVLVDGKGAVTVRFPPAYTKDDLPSDMVQLPVTVPTTEPGTLRLAFEAEYGDGRRALTQAVEVHVRTRAEKSKRDREWAEGSRAVEAFMKKEKASGHGCHDLRAYLAWLRAQPEVERADATPGGLSFILKKRPVPFVVHCH